MEDKQFDKILQEKLASYRTETGADWNRMYEQLSDEDFFDEDSEIDHLIQSKLASFVDTDHSSDWERFRQDLAEGVDTTFDSTLKATVQQAKADYRESHWTLLHESLLAEGYKRKRIAIIKGIEILILLLFISGVFTVLPVKSSLYDVPSYRPIVHSVQEIVRQGIASVESIWSVPARIEYRPLAPGAIPAAIGLGAETVTQDDSSWPFLPVDSEASSERSEPAQVSDGMKSLPMATLIPLVATPDDIGHLLPVPLIPEPINENKIYKTLSIGAGISHNIIEVPHVGSRGINPAQYTDTDHLVSATYGIRKGRVEAFTGLSYYGVSYSPLTTLGLVSNVAGQPIPLSEIEQVNYSYISIPLGLRVHALSSKDWMVYGTAGINMDLKMTTSYDLRALTNAELKLAESDPQAFGGDVYSREPFAPEAESGLLKGGRLGDNLSLTAFVGLGLSSNITKSIALYVQPTFHKSFSLDGSGAQDERIDNFRLEVGVSTFF